MRKAWTWNSIRVKLAVCLFIMIIPLTSLLIYNSIYSINVVRNQVANSNNNTISLFLDFIDKELEDANKYLSNIVAEETDLLLMAQTDSNDEFQKAKLRLYSKLSKDVTIYKMIDAFFLFSAERGDYVDTFAKNSTFEQRNELRVSLSASLAELPEINGFLPRSWKARKIGQDYYLFHIYKLGHVYMGAWVNAKKIVQPLKTLDLGESGRSLLMTDQGVPLSDQEFISENGIVLKEKAAPYYLTGKGHKYLIVDEKSKQGNFRLIALIPDEKILENLPYLRWLVAFVAAGSLIILPIGLFLLRKTVLVPLYRLLSAMKKVRQGVVDVRIEPSPTSDEFLVAYETFNTMMDQMQDLRIHVYEEQISKQRAELNYLMLQINPHFFLNSLNMLYTLSQVKNYAVIQELTLCLVNYFRHMLKSNVPFISLGQEVDHIRNYLHIQELRYPDSLTSEILVPEDLTNVAVPPLLIQTFVENSIKYAVTLDEPVHIMIRAVLDESEDEPCLSLFIEDSGAGFSREALAALNLKTDTGMAGGKSDKIGLWNASKRLELLYEGKAHIRYANKKPKGAVVEISLPIT